MPVTRTPVMVMSGWKYNGKVGYIRGTLQGQAAYIKRVHVWFKGEKLSVPLALTQLRDITPAELLLLGELEPTAASGLPNQATKS